ncbi:MAG: DUF6476 family protein [Amaricoccus sp.]
MAVDGPEDFPEPPRLRQLRWLVNALTATLIVGVIAIVTLLVIRLGPTPPSPRLPPSVRLPAGESARAVTFGSGWIAVVTIDGDGQERIRVIDSRSGEERAVTEIAPPP